MTASFLLSNRFRNSMFVLFMGLAMPVLAQDEPQLRPAPEAPEAAAPATTPVRRAPAVQIDKAPRPAARPRAELTPQSDEEIQRDREWLVAYLIAHQGYRIDQMDMLEKRIGRMSPTQVRTMVDVYRQKHEMAQQREQQWTQMRQQMLGVIHNQEDEQAKNQEDYRQELDKAADTEQNRLNTQQQEMMENFRQQEMYHQPLNNNGVFGPGGYGYGGFGGFNYGPYYDRYWH